MKIHKGNLALAVVFLLMSGSMFTDRNSGYGFAFHRYAWLLWLLGAAIWLYRAFRPGKTQL